MKGTDTSERECAYVCARSGGFYGLAKSKINESSKNPSLHEMKKKIENEVNEHHVFIYKCFPFHGYGKNLVFAKNQDRRYFRFFCISMLCYTHRV